MTHADAPPFEYVPVQPRHASVDRHEAVRVAVLHQLPSAARRHARMLHLCSAPPFAAHTPVSQEGTSRVIQQPSRSAHHTTQSDKHPIRPAVYMYSRRVSSSKMHTETRLGKRTSHAAPAASNSHLLHSRHTRSLLLHSRTSLRNTVMHQ